MKIIFLGTNGWYTDEKGNTPCILIDAENHYVIFDAGNGLYKLDQYITEDKPISLFISHFHLDHVSGLHTLAKFTFKQGIDVYVAPGRSQDFKNLVSPPYTVGFVKSALNVSDLRTEIRLHELTLGQNREPFPVTVVEMFHAYIDHGYRIELEGKIIAYSGDCGISDASESLARDSDTLIHECSLTEANPDDVWGHVDATQAATLAKKANVKKLLLTHFAPDRFKTLDARKIAEEKARAIFPESFAMLDDTVIEV